MENELQSEYLPFSRHKGPYSQMALVCDCGAYDSWELSEYGAQRCARCRRYRTDKRFPLLVVTGSSGAGKSTACAKLQGDPRVLALDADVFQRNAAAVSQGRSDYEAFWHYLLEVAIEIASNGLPVVFCGICLPRQLLTSPIRGAFDGVHFLALVSDEEVLEARLRARDGDDKATRQLAEYLQINEELKRATVAPPHTLECLDTTRINRPQLAAAVKVWISTVLSHPSPIQVKRRSATDCLELT